MCNMALLQSRTEREAMRDRSMNIQQADDNAVFQSRAKKAKKENNK